MDPKQNPVLSHHLLTPRAWYGIFHSFFPLLIVLYIFRRKKGKKLIFFSLKKNKKKEPANQPYYIGFCATSVTCGDSFHGVSFVDSSNMCGAEAASSSPTSHCCISPSKPIYCAAPHANSKCLNSNENRKAECVGGTFVKFVFFFPFSLYFSPIPHHHFFLSFANVYLYLSIKLAAFVLVAQMMMCNVVFFHKRMMIILGIKI